MVEEAGFLNFIGNKNDDHQFFERNHPQYDQGSYSIIYRANHRKTLEIVAIKQEFHGLSRSTLREIAALTSLPRHPAVIEFKEVVVDDRDHFFIIMEHLENDLKRFMDVKKKPLNLNEVKCIMNQFLEGVSPKILVGAEAYSCAIDMWPVGCIMAELLLKEVLFKGRCDLEQIAQIYIVLGNGEPDDNRLMQKFLAATSSTGAPSVTELGFDLLKKLLEYDPEKRITAEATLNHGDISPFLNSPSSLHTPTALDKAYDDYVCDMITLAKSKIQLSYARDCRDSSSLRTTFVLSEPGTQVIPTKPPKLSYGDPREIAKLDRVMGYEASLLDRHLGAKAQELGHKTSPLT
ncbi:Cyclin-dependent kinase G-2 [Sesamum angolense]|uniref:Cyclin-dependent kinase G-2 n=1 Tax=Sesamum angolense TaxID=2727404 RepID=A0AAE1X7Z6_9LAMI|nr:Cyclin-dependent kinase G-2 [Sesamum angolense]